MERKSYLLLLVVSISLVLISAPLFAGLSGPSKGRQQLVDALRSVICRSVRPLKRQAAVSRHTGCCLGSRTG